MPSPRPGSVTAAGVMAIIYGSLFLLCGLCGIGMMVARDTMGNDFMPKNDPMAAQVQEQVQEALERDAPAYHVFATVSTIVSLGTSVSLLIAGIGLMNMRSWARTLAIAACLIAIANMICQSAYQLIYAMPITSEAMERALRALPPGGPQAEQQQKLMQIMPVLMGVVMVILYAIFVAYLLAIVFFLRRRHVRAAFAAQEHAGSADRPPAEERRWGDDDDNKDWNQPV